jgi:hypothetical protein
MVVWCCATANTKPRFQPSDDAEYCLYVKLSASAGLTAKTSATAHTDAKFESFVTLVPPVLHQQQIMKAAGAGIRIGMHHDPAAH